MTDEQLQKTLNRMRILTAIFTPSMFAVAILAHFQTRFNWAWWVIVVLMTIALVVMVIEFRFISIVNRHWEQQSEQLEAEMKNYANRKAEENGPLC